MKKFYELSTLCGIEACAIIYDENNPQPEVWPSFSQVRNVLFRYMSLPDHERSKKMVNLETYLMQSIEKAQDLLRKQMEDNQKKEIADLIDRFIHTGEYNMGNMNLNDVTFYIDKNLKQIEKRMDSMEI
ncbi:agamous-like MADS-box protein AGL80 [Vicia villosa]|uniref:agamous-like MADS-box protein AGL80 n=1 Tax=Vicia villosa TaxID=3911 RepID=UPI00273BDBED|nr:agamous-like MADS-box protein AGL80 [Vicia villosa]